MRIFFIGDIVGKPGRRILSENLPRIREAPGIDFAIANAENAAGGNGITKNMAEELFRAGVDAITLGDHIWDQRCFEGEIDSLDIRDVALIPGIDVCGILLEGNVG